MILGIKRCGLRKPREEEFSMSIVKFYREVQEEKCKI